MGHLHARDSVFRRDGSAVYHTHSTDGRGVEALGSTWTVFDLGSLAGGLAPIGARRVVAQARRIRHLSRVPRGHTKMLPTATRLTCQRRRRNDFKKLYGPGDRAAGSGGIVYAAPWAPRAK
jgi:hypothetical protein